MDGSPPKAARLALFIQRVCELRHRSEPCDTMSRPTSQLGGLLGDDRLTRMDEGSRCVFGFLTLTQVFDGPEDFSSRQNLMFSDNNMSPVIMKMSPM